MRQIVTCPEFGHTAEIEYHEDPIDGHIQGITRCSIFQPPEDIGCDQECLKRMNKRFAANREQAERPPENSQRSVPTG